MKEKGGMDRKGWSPAHRTGGHVVIPLKLDEVHSLIESVMREMESAM